MAHAPDDSDLNPAPQRTSANSMGHELAPCQGAVVAGGFEPEGLPSR